MMHVGEVAKPAGAEGQLEAAQNFPQPEFRSELPDIRMQATPDTPDPNKELMDYMRSMGRVQTSEIVDYDQSLQICTRNIVSNTKLLLDEHQEQKTLDAMVIITTKRLAKIDEEKARADEDGKKRLDAEKGDISQKLRDQRNLLEGIRKIIKENKENLEKAKAKLPEQYSDANDQCINTIANFYDKVVTQKRSGYPYDHRVAEGTVDALLDATLLVKKNNERAITNLKDTLSQTKDVEEKKIIESQIDEIKEVQLWTQRSERDAKYLSGFTEVSVGQTASLPYHYDVVLQLKILASQYRALIPEESLEKMICEKMPGLEFESDDENLTVPEREAATKKIQETVLKSRIGLDIPFEGEKGYGGGEKSPGIIQTIEVVDNEGNKRTEPTEILGLKELGTHMQDDSFEARMKVAALSQCNLSARTEDGNTIRTIDNMRQSSFLKEHFSREDFIFYKEVFGLKVQKKDGSGIEKFTILSPHVTSKAKEVKLADARLEAILVTNAVRKLESIRALKDDSVKTDEVKKLANVVLKEANKRLREWDSRADADIVNRMAVLVTRQGLLQDYSFMHAYRYCWKFEWEIDDKGDPTKVKEVEIAPVTSKSGDIASLHFYRRGLDYDRTGKSRTPLVPSSSSGGRLEVFKMPYNEMPKVYEGAGFEKDGLIDAYLQEQLNFLFDPKWHNVRKEMGYRDINPDIAAKLKSWAIKWRVPFTVQWADEGAQIDRTKDKDLVIPLFFPSLDIANFFEAITTTGGKLNTGAKSAWTELKEGMDKVGDEKKRMSSISFNPPGNELNGLDNSIVDRWLIDQSMSSYYMNMLINTFDKEREEIYGLISGNPSILGPKEFVKRMSLTFRDAEGNAQEEYEIALIPFVIVQAIAQKYGIFSPGAWKIQGEETNTRVEGFFAEMAAWTQMLKWMPPDRADDKFRYEKIDIDNLDSEKYEKRGNDIFDKNTKQMVKVKEGYRVDEDGNKVQVWDYGEQLALVAEFYEQVIARVAKSSAEYSYSLQMKNYENTVKRINGSSFIGKGRLTRKIDERFTPQ